MTRETKIGLLVGLAFIIVIGILLSDHMTATNDLPQARLDKSADAIRGGIATPAPHDPPVTVIASAPPATSPIAQVLTRGEVAGMKQTPLSAQPTTRDSNANIEVAGPDGARAPIVIRENSNTPAENEATPGPTAGPTGTDVAGPTGAGRPDKWKWTQVLGEEIVDADPAHPSHPAGPQSMVEYTAEAGDNLSRVATKTMGASNKANRDAIVKANPTLQANPDRIIVGKVYLIPRVATAAAPARPAVPLTRDEGPAAKKGPEAGLATGQSWYTVKENDNLWKIAADQLGSGNAWMQLRELNKDILKDGQTVLPNMRLRLPAKPIASAQ